MSEPVGGVTRREVMRAGMMGAMGLLAGAAAPAWAGGRPYGPFHVGVQSYSLRAFGFDEALAKTRALGLHYWEAFQAHIPLTEALEQQRNILEKLRAARVRLMAWGVEGFDADEAKARRVLGFARAMRIGTVTADPSPEALPVLDRLTREYKVNIGIHNHGPGARYGSIASLEAAVRDRGPRIGVCLDTGHLMRSGDDPVEAVRRLGKRLHATHLKDVRNRTEFTEVGRGDMDTVGLFRELRKLRFPGIVALEYEEHPDNPTPYMDLCLAATRDAIDKSAMP
ncbi:MAG: sugar phosphate isomerase/epimerase [Chthonomonadales bacterium]|nr:sugar phosphate isomerase/epimerase [Chthonomonadales bacterium]